MSTPNTLMPCNRTAVLQFRLYANHLSHTGRVGVYNSQRQGFKRDLFFRDRDETETETFFEMSQTVQPVKLLASNCYKLSCVSFIYYAKHSSVSATVLQKLSRHFPKDCQQFFLKSPLLHDPTIMHQAICNDYLITIFRKNKKLTK